MVSPSSEAPTTTSSVSPTTTVAPIATAPPPTTLPSDPTAPIVAPATPEKDDVALDALLPVDGYTVIADLSGDDYELFALFDAWLPQQIIDGLAAALFEGPDGERVAVLSTIPLTGLRGDPNLPDFYAVSAGRGETVSTVVDGITTINAASGGTFEFWSDGDGVLIATAVNSVEAHNYMVSRAETDLPNGVWESESCLYLAPSDPSVFGVYPYAPFMADLVVPCAGPHNAEVMLAEFEATTQDEFDAEAIFYQRNYDCDREYQSTFGSSVEDHRASLITYMPDEDEWNRGDRYLACVVVLFDQEGEPLLFEGDMADQPNLELETSPEDCTDGSSSNVIDCGSIHEQQYVGSVMVDGDVYPTLGDDRFDDACKVYLPDLTTIGGAELVVFALGLLPYSFEQGDREVQCYASAVVDGFLPVDVVGSFYGEWTVVDTDATSA
jgi:hypothetical protein